jgi:BirA family transcriptional regulator, biotin operon repressor / biotin---[acetyl-CoA-carboxylase] ligase
LPDLKLTADDLQEGLKTRVIGKRVLAYEDLDSTNKTCWEMGEQGLPEGTCVFAEHQKKGRGRLGRVWNSPKSQNILMSVLLRPAIEPSAVSRVTLAAALAVIRAIEEETGLKPGVKWPNDVLLEHKKLCGILTEMSAETDRVNFIVLGIGLNVNARGKDLPPGSISLYDALQERVDRLALAQKLLRQLERYYEKLKKGKADGICEEWESLSETTGKHVTAKLLGRTVQGIAAGIDADGALWIRHDNGLQERILSGDVQEVRKKEPVK